MAERGGIIKLSENQKWLLSEMASCHDKGVIWHPENCYGGGDAKSIKSLWDKGLAEKYKRLDGRDSGYSSLITEKGIQALRANP